MMGPTALATGFAVALGIGLLIGAERERKKRLGPKRNIAGIRTFSIASLLGAGTMALGGGLVTMAAALGVAVIVAAARWRVRQDDPGVTTEIALVATVMVGALAMTMPLIAAGLGVAIAGLLYVRAPIHRFVRTTLTEFEMRDAMILATAALIILPLVPNVTVGPFHAINPRSIGMIIVLVMVIGAVGHTALRTLGPGIGLPLAGLIGGFVSSTMTIASMATRAEEFPGLRRSAVAAAVLSAVATTVQIEIIVGTISPDLASLLIQPMVAGGAAAALYGLVTALGAVIGAEQPRLSPGRAFSLRSTLILALFLSAVLILAAACKAWLGERGALVAIAVAGLVDAHAPAYTAGSMVAEHTLLPGTAVMAVLTALTINTCVKGAAALSAGGIGFGLRVIPGLALQIAAVWLSFRFPLW